MKKHFVMGVSVVALVVATAMQGAYAAPPSSTPAANAAPPKGLVSQPIPKPVPAEPRPAFTQPMAAPAPSRPAPQTEVGARVDTRGNVDVRVQHSNPARGFEGRATVSIPPSGNPTVDASATKRVGPNTNIYIDTTTGPGEKRGEAGFTHSFK